MKSILSFFFCLFTVFISAQNIINNDDKSYEIEEMSSDTEEIPYAIIERVPIYKGCDERLDNTLLKKCTNKSINFLVSENFNTSIGHKLKLSSKAVKISCFFKIDQKGDIVDIKVRAPHPDIEKEAIRVLKLIPKFKKPGMQKGKAVKVPFYLPIKYTIKNNKKSKSKKTYSKDLVVNPDTYPVYKRCENSLTNLEAKHCTTEKIMDFIKLSFNIELADKLFPQDKSTKFQVDFIINRKGKVEKITAKAYKKEIAAEVIRVLKRLPKFKKPGYKDGKAVNVPVSILMEVYF